MKKLLFKSKHVSARTTTADDELFMIDALETGEQGARQELDIRKGQMIGRIVAIDVAGFYVLLFFVDVCSFKGRCWFAAANPSLVMRSGKEDHPFDRMVTEARAKFQDVEGHETLGIIYEGLKVYAAYLFTGERRT